MGAAVTVRLLHGDCCDVLKTLPDASVDSIVTDPPYELTTGKKGGTGTGGFMGLAWDSTGVAFDAATWLECLRVLKPGGHMLAFSGTRTYHRMVCAIEDAGFEIRDQIGWAFGSGFPKSHNGPWGGTALKPAWEPICMARKPLVGTVEANWREHGTGALNIDGCRVATDGESFSVPQSDPTKRAGTVGTDLGISGATVAEFKAAQRASIERTATLGRWPANLIHDGSEEVLQAFPWSKDGVAVQRNGGGQKIGATVYSGSGGGIARPDAGFGGEGSAARFFYCAKASRTDRDEGLDGMPQARTGGMKATADGSMLTGAGNERTTVRANTHPTVKPTDLMRYLCRLVTPPGGVVLDPFMGSGSTLKAAELEGFDAIGIELSAEYIEIARRRITADAPLFTQIEAAA